MDITLLLLGIVCVIGAIAGGGLEALGTKIPVISSRPRQIILGAAGIILIIYSRTFPSSNPPPTATEAPTLTSNTHIPAPVAQFAYQPTYLIPERKRPVTVQFFDNSIGTIDAREWNLGDGTVLKTDSPPKHTYEKIGVYNITLDVTGPGGSDSAMQTFSTIESPLKSVTWRILLTDRGKGEAIAEILPTWSAGSSLVIEETPPDELLDTLSAQLAAGSPPELMLLSPPQLVTVLNMRIFNSLVALDEILSTSNYPETKLGPARVDGQLFAVPYGEDYLLSLAKSPDPYVVGFIAHLTQALER